MRCSALSATRIQAAANHGARPVQRGNPVGRAVSGATNTATTAAAGATDKQAEVSNSAAAGRLKRASTAATTSAAAAIRTGESRRSAAMNQPMRDREKGPATHALALGA